MTANRTIAMHRLEYAIGVGGNRGPVCATAHQALTLLTRDGQVAAVGQAPWYRSAAVGGPSGQEDYLNTVWVVRTALGPHQLLARLQMVETACGRVRTCRWGPRTLDLDLLLRRDGAMVASQVLTLPHPRLAVRSFVLAPLVDVAPDWWHPRLARRLKDLPCPLDPSMHRLQEPSTTARE